MPLKVQNRGAPILFDVRPLFCILGYYSTKSKYNSLCRHDHAKWAISLDKKKPFICVGDINRMETQRHRAGGTACFRNRSVHVRELAPLLRKYYFASAGECGRPSRWPLRGSTPVPELELEPGLLFLPLNRNLSD